MNNWNKKRAFTLAELLVAMFIFALVATMLVPNVTQNAEKSLFATQLKKVQNDIQQALLVMMSQNQGTLQSFCLGDDQASSSCFRNEIAKKLEKRVSFDGNVEPKQEDCDNARNEITNACIQKQEYIDREPILMNKQSAIFYVNNIDTFSAVNLTNGATVSVIFDPKCQGTSTKPSPIAYSISESVSTNVTTAPAKLCGYVEIDLNAGKGPNMVGKDIHYFWIIDKDGIVPFGELDDFTCGNEQIGGNYTPPKKTKEITAENTLGCTYRLIQKGSIDYY